jgi:hypothetical protein
MKNTLQFVSLVLVSAMVVAACGDDGETGGSGGGGSPSTGGSPTTGGSPSTGGGGNPSTGGGGDGGGGGNPAPPEPGAQIDRMGRPAINTALMGTFVLGDETGALTGVSSDPVRGMLQNEYNADGVENDWADYRGMFARNLAILDALDVGAPGGGCGNVAGYGMDCDDTLSCYGLIAGVRANDRLFVDTSQTGCSAASSAGDGYLAVEFRTLGVPGFDTACGGRRPIDDVIATTYSAVAGIPFDDGITAPANTHPEMFPYLADPQ